MWQMSRGAGAIIDSPDGENRGGEVPGDSSRHGILLYRNLQN